MRWPDLLRSARMATGRCTREAKFEALQRHYIRINHLSPFNIYKN